MTTENYRLLFLDFLSEKTKESNKYTEPKNLYDPIHYILQIGGKRIRPILTLMSCDLFGANYKDALDAALAIEMFHNFTLIHDDIMDQASIRRGEETVHKKWNKNIGILSGDALMILSYQMLEPYNGKLYRTLQSLFNRTALQICEGQQYDIDFESRDDVSIEEYIKMISHKTAVLLACSLQMGALIANASEEDVRRIYDFGLNLGIAFQLQDDYLDTFGAVDFGKKLGGDILENKKTFLYLRTFELASRSDQIELLKMYSTTERSEEKIQRVTSLFNKYQITDFSLKEIEKYASKAYKNIDALRMSDHNKKKLLEFGQRLMYRKV